MENFRFKKSYGQNFLQDHNIICNIVKETKIKPNSLILEVGPGSGALTMELAKYGKNVLSYEIDTEIAKVYDFDVESSECSE